jgi:hypothetical protein
MNEYVIESGKINQILKNKAKKEKIGIMSQCPRAPPIYRAAPFTSQLQQDASCLPDMTSRYTQDLPQVSHVTFSGFMDNSAVASLQSIQDLFKREYPHSDLSYAYLDPQNMAQNVLLPIKLEVAQRAQMNPDDICIIPNEWFTQYTYKMAIFWSNYAKIDKYLQMMNNITVREQAKAHYLSLRNGLLYKKYAIENDRPVLMDLPVESHQMRKRETVISPLALTLSNTFAHRYFRDYLALWGRPRQPSFSWENQMSDFAKSRIWIP